MADQAEGYRCKFTVYEKSVIQTASSSGYIPDALGQLRAVAPVIVPWGFAESPFL